MSVLTDAELDALLDEFPVLAGRPRELTELSGGLTNRNVKVTTPDGVYVARCTGETMLGIDRGAELFNTRAAEQAGVGAPLIDHRLDRGVLLLGYIDGKTFSDNDFRQPGVLARVAAVCRDLHRGPRFRGRFDMCERQAFYLRTASEHGFRIPADYLDHAEVFTRICTALAATDDTTVPCNNDLLAENFIDDGHRLWLIDYEYSGNNDPCFELGNIASESGLSSDQLAELVTAYYGRPLRHKIARAELQGLAAKYGWTLWGCIQNGSSPIDFDFWSWAMERYEPAVAAFRGPRLSRLLDDVTAHD
jgi:thiamine kinase-like enzyme